MALQFLGGYNTIEHRILFLNNQKLNNDDLLIWEDENKLKKYIEENKKKIKESNVYTIKLKNKNQFDYIKQSIVEWDDEI